MVLGNTRKKHRLLSRNDAQTLLCREVVSDALTSKGIKGTFFYSA